MSTQVTNRNWKDIKLGFQIIPPSAYNGGSAVRLPVPTRFTSNTRQDYDIVDGIEAGNQGVIAKYARYTFNITMWSNIDQARLLQTLLDDQQSFIFDVAMLSKADQETLVKTIEKSEMLADQDYYGFRLLGEQFRECYLTSSSYNVEIMQLPAVTFAGIALRKNPMVYSNTDNKYQFIGDFAAVANLYYGDGIAQNMAKLRTQRAKDIFKMPSA